MEPPIKETTNPATADFGMRTFDVQLSENQIIEIAVTQRVREDCPGEIHATDKLLISSQVTRNGDATTAITALQQAFAASLPSAQSLVS